MFCLNGNFICLFVHITVCQLWKNVALRRWKKINIIGYSKTIPQKWAIIIRDDNVFDLSPRDAKKIVAYIAPFVEFLMVYDNFEEDMNFLRFGSFWYKVKKLNSANPLKLLASNSTKIIGVYFFAYPPPEVKLIKPLFESNKVKTFMVIGPDSYYEHLRTDSIQNLHLVFSKDHKDVKSLEGVIITSCSIANTHLV